MTGTGTGTGSEMSYLSSLSMTMMVKCCKWSRLLSIINSQQRKHWLDNTCGVTRKRDKVTYLSKITIFHTHLHSTPPVKESKFPHNISYAKTRIMRLAKDEKV